MLKTCGRTDKTCLHDHKIIDDVIQDDQLHLITFTFQFSNHATHPKAENYQMIKPEIFPSGIQK